MVEEVALAVESSEPEPAQESAPAPEDEGEFGYVPMSEWLDDLERK